MKLYEPVSISVPSNWILSFQRYLQQFCIPVALGVLKGGVITPSLFQYCWCIFLWLKVTGLLSAVRLEDMEGNSVFFGFSCLQCENWIGDGV